MAGFRVFGFGGVYSPQTDPGGRLFADGIRNTDIKGVAINHLCYGEILAVISLPVQRTPRLGSRFGRAWLSGRRPQVLGQAKTQQQDDYHRRQ